MEQRKNWVGARNAILSHLKTGLVPKECKDESGNRTHKPGTIKTAITGQGEGILGKN